MVASVALGLLSLYRSNDREPRQLEAPWVPEHSSNRGLRQPDAAQVAGSAAMPSGPRATLWGPHAADARSPDPPTPPRPAPCSSACAPLRRAGSRCSWCRRRPTSTTTSASWPRPGSCSAPRCVTFRGWSREIAARGRRPRARRSGRVARERVVRAAVARHAAAGAGAARRARPASPPRPASCSPSSRRTLVTPARFTRALRGWAAAAGARARGGARRALLGLPPAAGARSAAVDERGLRPRGAGRAARAARRRGARGRCSSTASTT